MEDGERAAKTTRSRENMDYISRYWDGRDTGWISSGWDQSDDDGRRGLRMVFLSLIHHFVGCGASLAE